LELVEALEEASGITAKKTFGPEQQGGCEADLGGCGEGC